MIDETVEEIADMQTHSSSVVATKAARALLELIEREYPTVEEYERALDQNSSALRGANRSHASLQTTQREIVSRVEEADVPDVAAAKEVTREAVEDVIDRVQHAKERAGERAVQMLEDGDTVFTFDYSSTVMEAFELADEENTSLTVYCAEARPRLLGRKMARTLGEFENVESHLVVDGACGYFMPECDHVMIGMDCIVDETLYNRLGTYPLVATAAEMDVPVRVVGASSKVVGTGFVFENEERAVSEVILEPADGFAVENPAYDATPIRFIDTLITDESVIEF